MDAQRLTVHSKGLLPSREHHIALARVKAAGRGVEALPRRANSYFVVSVVVRLLVSTFTSASTFRAPLPFC